MMLLNLLWRIVTGKDIDDQVEIEYSKEFQRADIDIKLQRLFNVFNLNLRPIKQMALKGI